MKRRILVAIAMLLVVAMSLSSCGVLDWVKKFFEQNVLSEVELTDAPLNAEKAIDFAEGANHDVLFESDGWSNGDVFNVVWKQHNVHYENGIMRLGITEEEASAWLDDVQVAFNYTAGEARTQNYYHYGDYEVSMKPSANPGTASTFFVCTGPYDEKDGVPNPHDEIDIEFLGNNGLGKDTTKVQFNFFVDGKGGNEYMYDLGFDASEAFHTYGFRWTPDSITWFVDGEPVYKVTTDKSVTPAKNLRVVDAIPQTAGRMLANYWCGNEDAHLWMGKYNGETADNGTQYQWIATSAVGAPLNPAPQPPAGDEGGDEGETTVQYEFKTDHPVYALTTTEQPNSVRVTYDSVTGNSWSNVNSWIEGKVNGYNTVTFKLINHGTESVKVFVQLQQGASAENAFVVEAGAELDCSLSYTGTPKLILFFVGSTEGTETDIYSGDITIANMAFSYVEPAGGEPEQPGEGEGPVTPPATSEPTQFEYWWASDPSLYTFDGSNPITIEYNGTGSGYQCVGGHPSNYVTGQNTFTVTITNNGEVASKIRLDIKNSKDVACNISAVAEGYDVETTEGAVIEIPAGASATLVVTFDPTDCPVSNVVLFVDTIREDAATVYHSNITLSNMSFSQVGGTAPEQPEQPEQPEVLPDGEWLKFEANDIYTLHNEQEYVNSIRITYSAAENQTYLNINSYIKDKAEGKTTVKFKVTNNGSDSVVLTAKVEKGLWPDNTTLGLVDKIEIAAGETKIITIEYTDVPEFIYFMLDTDWADPVQTHAGDVTISNICFSGEAAAPEQPEPVEMETLTVTFGSEGNYKTPVDMVDLTNVYIGDNGADNAQVKQGYITVNLPAGSKLTINGYPGYTAYNINGGELITDTTYVYEATEAVTLTINADPEASGKNYFYSLVIEYPKTAAPEPKPEPIEMETLTVTFGSEGNYKTPVDMVDLTNVYIGDNGADNAQVKQGYITVNLPAGSKLTINGYSGYTAYNINGGELITDTTYVYEATEAVTLTINADPEASGKNYFYSLVIGYPKTSAPEQPESSIQYKDMYVEFKTEAAYTLTSEQQYWPSVRITYDNIAGNTWGSCVTVWLNEEVETYTVYSMKITNNGDKDVSVWTQIQGQDGSNIIDENVVVAPGEEKLVTFNLSDKPKMALFFIDSTHAVPDGIYAGDITISEVKLGK